MSFRVVVEAQAEADLLRLYGHLVESAAYLEDLDAADRALGAIRAAMAALATTPFLFRRAAGDKSGGPLRRELVVPFGKAGYVIAYEIASPELVVVLAVRHQREEDYH